MIVKAKRDRLIFSLIAIFSAIIAIATTAVVIMLVLKQNYMTMWFILGASAICFYVSVFFTFSAIDRNTAVRVLAVIDALGTSDAAALAKKLGWTDKATAKFINSCTKWGYIGK